MIQVPAAGARSVLIVDADLLCSRALARDFKSIGYDATVATTPEEAIGALDAMTPTFILLDLHMNQNAGLELLKRWGKATPKLSVILISSHASLALAIEAMREGALGFCAKPVTADVVLREFDQRTASAPPSLPSKHRLCAQTLRAEGVDRFFALSQGLMCVAGFDGYFKMLNRSWQDTLGYSLDELCARPYLELVHPEDRVKARDEAVLICEGEPIFYFRNRYRCKSGAYKWLAWTAAPSPAHQLIYASATDITAAVALEERLSATASRLRSVAVRREEALDTSSETNEHLLQLARFKEEMTNLIVHDLKNPLTVVLANYEYVMSEIAASPECVEALTDSQTAARRMLRLLANLLDVGRLEEDRLLVNGVATDLTQLFGDILGQRKVIGRGRQLTMNAELLSDATIEVDRDLLTRTAENILDNALRYTPAGGRIEVELRDAGDDIEVRIGNSGLSVPLAERVAIFDKHHQISPHADHTSLGLGLYFCRLATEAQGGRIWVEESPSLPTIFAIRLPRSRTPRGPAASASSEGE